MNRKRTARIIGVYTTGVASIFMLVFAGLEVLRERLLWVTLYGAVAVICTVQFAACLVSLQIHNRFDKLEKRLDELAANKPKGEQENE